MRFHPFRGGAIPRHPSVIAEERPRILFGPGPLHREPRVFEVGGPAIQKGMLGGRFIWKRLGTNVKDILVDKQSLDHK